MTKSVLEHAQRETNMSADAAAAPRRLDRRKARTRAALVGAAQRFLADGKTNVSIQEITDAADVGFGSFYNHFSTKDELFAEAVSATLDTWGALRDKMVAGLDDPAEIFAMSFRMTGRLQRLYPELVRGLLNSGISVLKCGSQAVHSPTTRIRVRRRSSSSSRVGGSRTATSTRSTSALAMC